MSNLCVTLTSSSVAWVCPWCTHPEGERSVGRSPNQPTRWHYIRRQCLPTPTMADDTFYDSKYTKAGFNTTHCRARCVIERLNWVLKRRFACLNHLRVEPQKVCNITLACMVMHNIAIKHNVSLCADNVAPEFLGYPYQPPAFCQNEQTGRATNIS